MSKRTDAIYNSLNKLDDIQKSLLANKDNFQETDNLIFSMGQELKNMRFWIDSLYRYNGKSTSAIKKNTSAENGKKGGRPPKEISEARKNIKILENEEIPDLDHKIIMADSNEELNSLKNQREEAFDKLQQCRLKIKKWEENK